MRVREIGAVYEVRLIDVSPGGFLASAPIPYPLNADRDFVFLAPDEGWRAPLRARAVYSHRKAAADWPEYLTGFTFLDQGNQMVAARIGEIVAHAADGLSVD